MAEGRFSAVARNKAYNRIRRHPFIYGIIHTSIPLNRSFIPASYSQPSFVGKVMLLTHILSDALTENSCFTILGINGKRCLESAVALNLHFCLQR